MKKAQPKDPYCCILDKMHAATDGFDRGALVAYEGMRYAVAQLSKEDVLEVIEHNIADLRARVDEHRKKLSTEKKEVTP